VEKQEDWLKLRNFEGSGMLIMGLMNVGSIKSKWHSKKLLTFPRPQQQQQTFKK
jgi:hypothetical protein